MCYRNQLLPNGFYQVTLVIATVPFAVFCDGERPCNAPKKKSSDSRQLVRDNFRDQNKLVGQIDVVRDDTKDSTYVQHAKTKNKAQAK